MDVILVISRMEATVVADHETTLEAKGKEPIQFEKVLQKADVQAGLEWTLSAMVRSFRLGLYVAGGYEAG